MGWWQCVLAAGGAAGGFIVRRWRAAPSELYLPGTTTRHYTGQQPLPGLQGSLMTSTQTWLSSCHNVIMTSWHGDTNVCYTTHCLTVNRITLFWVFLNNRSNLLVLVVQEGEGNWLTRQIFKSEPWHYILCFCSFVWFKIQVDHNNE